MEFLKEGEMPEGIPIELLHECQIESVPVEPVEVTLTAPSGYTFTDVLSVLYLNDASNRWLSAHYTHNLIGSSSTCTVTIGEEELGGIDIARANVRVRAEIEE